MKVNPRWREVVKDAEVMCTIFLVTDVNDVVLRLVVTVI